MPGLVPARRGDGRSRRVVALIECILNQNVRDCGAACSPAINAGVVEICLRHAVGMIQIPCPEQAALGLARVRPSGLSLHEAMHSAPARRCCDVIAERIVERLQEHQRSGHTVIAILGGNPRSPGCATHVAGTPGGAEGALIVALRAGLARRGLDLPLLAVRDSDPRLHADDLARFEALCAARAQD